MTTSPATDPLAQDFVRFAVDAGVLRFGEFKTKAGRLSPYFFNAGLFDDGAKLGRLAEFYARRLLASGLQFDMLFGPAYKGITLALWISMGIKSALTSTSESMVLAGDNLSLPRSVSSVNPEVTGWYSGSNQRNVILSR